MKRISPLMALAICAYAVSLPGQTPTAQNVPIVRHYDLDITVQPAESRYRAEARIEFTNVTAQPIAQVPVLLYRLVRVGLGSLSCNWKRGGESLRPAPHWPSYLPFAAVSQRPES
jgi:hypothetical protein